MARRFSQMSRYFVLTLMINVAFASAIEFASAASSESSTFRLPITSLSLIDASPATVPAAEFGDDVVSIDSSVGAAKIDTQCGRETAPLEWNYCVHRTVGSTNQDVVLLFHGAREDEKSWLKTDIYKEVRDEWDRASVQAPVVVTFSFGEGWLLVEKNSTPDSGKWEIFMTNVVPKLDALTRDLGGRRIILGHSMGGYNAAQVLFKNALRVDRAAILCPMFFTVSPFAPSSEIKAYINRTNANSFYTKYALNLLKGMFEDDAGWKKADPIVLAQKSLSTQTPKLHMSCGSEDDFGLMEGSTLVATTAKQKGAPIEWYPVSGGHCSANTVELARFLTQK